MTAVSIRRATVSDLDELAVMRRAFTAEDPSGTALTQDFEAAFARVIGEGLSDGSWVVWLAEVDQNIVAHAFVALIPKVPRPAHAPTALGYLTNVYTRVAYRGQGVGSALLEAVLRWARDAELELLVVWPSEESERLYRRLGFSSHGEPLVWLNE